MEIVAASLLDLNAVNKLEHACFGKDAWPMLDIIAVLTFPDIVRLKVVENGQVIGFVAGDMHTQDGVAWIATIGIAPEYRRRGLGRELLRACESRLRGSRVRLSVRASNDGAITLYEQEGYRRVDVWQGYYNDGEAAIVMEKQRT